MCCFTDTVEMVANTRIFARAAGRRQVIAYAMELSARDDLAMVLPIPVPAGAPPDAVRFLSLEDHPRFFAELSSLFVEMAGVAGTLDELDMGADLDVLEVHEVGAFDASFVPSPGDFVRLDRRFRIDESVWSAVPEPGYDTYGFAVFKLRAGANQEVHPMAFEFPTRRPGELFFPTVHVHDGRYHEDAEFAHALYGRLETPARDAEEGPIAPFVVAELETSVGALSLERAAGDPGSVEALDGCSDVLGEEGLLFRAGVHGLHPNRDVWMAARAVADLLAS